MVIFYIHSIVYFFQGSGIDDEGAIAIAELLKENNSIKELSLGEI